MLKLRRNIHLSYSISQIIPFHIKKRSDSGLVNSHNENVSEPSSIKKEII